MTWADWLIDGCILGWSITVALFIWHPWVPRNDGQEAPDAS